MITLRGLVKTQQKEINRLKNLNSSLIEQSNSNKSLENALKIGQQPLLDFESQIPTHLARRPSMQVYSERDSEVSIVAHYRIKWEYVEDFEEWVNRVRIFNFYDYFM